MSEGIVAKRYAQALFELGVESGQLTAISDKLMAFAQSWKDSRELRAAIENPVLDAKVREGVIGDVARRLGAQDVLIKALILMARRRRLSVVGEVAAQLRELADEKGGVLRAHVTTAQKMPEAYYASITERLSQITKKKVVLERAQEPSLIGGAIARIGDAVIDGSLRGRLDEAERAIVSALSASVPASS